jgi:predicted Zn-ribbon and HTH transcriptional regulator
MSNPGVAPVEAPSSDVDGAVAALENARVLLESGTPDDVRQHITHAIGLLRPFGVSGSDLPGVAYGTQALGTGHFDAEPARCRNCGGTWSQHDGKGRCPNGVTGRDADTNRHQPPMTDGADR